MTELVPLRGEVWWAVADKRRPVLVVQSNFLNRSRLGWVLAVPLTTNLSREGLPGNVRLAKGDSGLLRACVANVAHVAPLYRGGFTERVGRVPEELLARVSDGLRLVMSL